MTIAETRTDLDSALAEWRGAGLAYAFVPTMGALHLGHIHLVLEARKAYDKVVVSIFVNPTQFDRAEDLERYPRQVATDAKKLLDAGADVLFVPTVAEVYPPDAKTPPLPDLGGLDTRYEGEMRPGHFAGVVQVVRRLVELVQPAAMYMGQKDAQQVAVLRRAASVEAWPVEIVAVPTIREDSGLAMSSRNAQLSTDGFAEASQLYAALVQAAQQWSDGGDASSIGLSAKHRLSAAGFTPEYFDLVNAADFSALDEGATVDDANRPLLWVVVAWYEGVRLIDNLPVT